MAANHESLIRTAHGDWARVGSQPIVTAVVVGAGLIMLVFGVWAFAWPASFAAFVQFPYHLHSLHDLGALQIGLGAALVAALWMRDAITVALTGFVVATAVHAVSHFIDRDLGGRSTDWIMLTVLALIAVAAIVARLRFLKERPSVT